MAMDEGGDGATPVPRGRSFRVPKSTKLNTGIRYVVLCLPSGFHGNCWFGAWCDGVEAPSALA